MFLEVKEAFEALDVEVGAAYDKGNEGMTALYEQLNFQWTIRADSANSICPLNI